MHPPKPHALTSNQRAFFKTCYLSVRLPRVLTNLVDFVRLHVYLKVMDNVCTQSVQSDVLNKIVFHTERHFYFLQLVLHLNKQNMRASCHRQMLQSQLWNRWTQEGYICIYSSCVYG